MKWLQSFGSQAPQLLAVFSATINAVSDGMSYGWSSPIVPILRSPDTPVEVSESVIIWLESLYMIGPIVCMPLTIVLVDKLGRKAPLILSSIFHLIHWFLLAFAYNPAMLIVARFMTGLSGNLIYVGGPMYIAEIADQNLRGFLGSFVFIMQLVGILLIYAVGPFVTIMVSSLVGAIFPILQLISFPFLPETPYYHFIKGNNDAAKKSLQFLRGSDNVDDELKDIQAAVKRQSEEKGRLKDIVTVDSNRKAVVIICVLNAAQHLCGSTVMFMNLHTMLEDAKGILSPNSASIIFSAVMLVASLASSAILDKAGRKHLLVGPSFVTGISQLAMAIYFSVKAAGIDVSNANWVPIVAVIVYAASYKFGLGLVPIVMAGEVFPTSVKSMAMTILDAVYVFFGVICIYLYHWLESDYGQDVPFYVFAVVAFAATLFSQFAIPETKGKTLEEIQFMLKGQPIPMKDLSSPT